VTGPKGIVITGTGCISALGADVESSMAALYDGVVQPPTVGSVPSTLEKAPPVFCVTEPVEEGGERLLNRTSALAIVAAREAVRRSWGGRIDAAPDRIGVCMGTTVGCTFNEEEFYRAYHAGGRPDVTAISRFLRNDLSTVVAEELGAKGPVITVGNACASSSDTIGVARDWLDAGLCDVVIAGGADELARFAYLGFAVLKNCATDRCRPFDKNRRGLNLGEGAAAVVLERGESAIRRRAEILAEVKGYASASDAHHMTAPHPEGRGLRQAISAALEQAGLQPRAIDFINAHGTGTSENDRIEGRVLADTFGTGAAVFSTKGYTGHTLGGAGALEAVLAIHNLVDGKIPASAGFSTPDPECVLVPVTSTTDIRATTALSTSLAFGGSNTALVLSRELG
jgi:3-oxoacyl-[acyl-carrier-protein] synthase-1/3-oxoacyl-[acyl-carrier-protein] synthase II